jgi:hypothetical protein
VTGVENDDEGWLEAMTFADGTRREYRGGFAMYGSKYNTELAEALGCDLNDDGTIAVDDHGRTSVDDRFLFDRDSLNFGVFGQVAVEDERDFTEFREPQFCPTARAFELEAGLTVGETAILARCLPVERPDAIAVLFATPERREVVVQPLDDFLKNLRVNVFQVVPPLLETRQEFLFAVCRGIVGAVESVKEVVVDLPTGIDSPR